MKQREIQELEEEKQVSNKSTPSGFLLAACKGNTAELLRFMHTSPFTIMPPARPCAAT